MGLLGFLIKSAAIGAAEKVAVSAFETTNKIIENKEANNVNITRMPKDYRDYIGKEYTDVVEELRAYGFENISLLPAKDLITTIFKKEGMVKTISINGKSSFSKNQKFRLDSRVVITFHSLKNS